MIGIQTSYKIPMKLTKRLLTIKEDCIQLKRKGYLHDYGEGQLDLIDGKTNDQNPTKKELFFPKSV